MSAENITGHYDPRIIRQIQSHGILQEGSRETPLELAHRLGIVSLSDEQLVSLGMTQPSEPEV